MGISNCCSGDSKQQELGTLEVENLNKQKGKKNVVLAFNKETAYSQ